MALGTFDGVHTGHRAVISAAVKSARDTGCVPAVWCFSHIPKNFFLTMDKRVPLLSSCHDKINEIESLGVGLLVMPDVTHALLSMPATEFLARLYDSLSPSGIVCGYNYSFGCGAAGTPDTLREFFEPLGVPVTVINPVSVDGVYVSSTLIRDKIEAGDFGGKPDAASLLGRPYSVGGIYKSGIISLDGTVALPPAGDYNVSLSARSDSPTGKDCSEIITSITIVYDAVYDAAQSGIRCVRALPHMPAPKLAEGDINVRFI